MTVRLHQVAVLPVVLPANGQLSEKKHVPITARYLSVLVKVPAPVLRARQALAIAHRRTHRPLHLLRLLHRVVEVIAHPPVAPQVRPVLEIVVASRHSLRRVDPASCRGNTQG